MKAIFESFFSIVYLVIIFILGTKIMRGAKSLQGKIGKTVENEKAFVLFGAMTLILGFGDSFHLFPRIWALNTVGTESFAAPLGFGTLATSITMTIFMFVYIIFGVCVTVFQVKMGSLLLYMC